VEDKTFKLLEKMYIEFTNFRKETNERFDRVESDISGLKKQGTSLESEVKKTNITLEHDIKPKLEALFDGYTQNTQQLDRIATAVSRHEDIIMKKVK